MVAVGWRKAFCTSIPKDPQPNLTTTAAAISGGSSDSPTNKIKSPIRVGGSSRSSSNPPSPPPAPTATATSPVIRRRAAEAANLSPPLLDSTDRGGNVSSSSPSLTALRCRIGNKTTPGRKIFNRSSSDSNINLSSSSSSSSSSPLSFFKSKSKSSNGNKDICGICFHSTTTTTTTTASVFIAECSHAFHISCLSRRRLTVTENLQSSSCPVCRVPWKEPPLPLPVCGGVDKEASTKSNKSRSYDDDEPLTSPAPGSRFNPIPESDENEDDEDAADANEAPDRRFLGILSTAAAATLMQRRPARGVVGAAPLDQTDRAKKKKDDVIVVAAAEPEVRFSSESAVISVGRAHHTYTAVLKIKAPAPPTSPSMESDSLETAPRRAPIDIVVVVDVGSTSGVVSEEAAGGGTDSSTSPRPVRRLQGVKRAMRLVVSSLSASDRLSIVAFSGSSKRLLPLRRMTASGRRSARRVVDALFVVHGGPAAVTGGSSVSSCVSDAIRKAAKVLEDRREKNHAASILLLTDSPTVAEDHGEGGEEENVCPSSDDITAAASSHHRHRRSSPPFLSSTRYSNLGIPLHFLNLGSIQSDSSSEAETNQCIRRLLNVVVTDLQLHLSFASTSTTNSSAAEISAAYTLTGRPSSLCPGSPDIGDLYADEERRILLEIRVPATSSPVGSHRHHHILSVRCCYRDPITGEMMRGDDKSVVVPWPRGVGSSEPKVQRLRSLFLVTRAVAESRRMADKGDLDGAFQLLSSARALLAAKGEVEVAEFRRVVEAEMGEVEQSRRVRVQEEMVTAQRRDQRRRVAVTRAAAARDDNGKGEVVTPMSAWKAAERLAKVAIMRKSMNRVSDLHGFEDARF